MKDYDFVLSIIKLIGNFNGTTCGHYKHLFSAFIPAFLPLFGIKKNILKHVGTNISNYYNKK